MKCIWIERTIQETVKKHKEQKIPKEFPSRILGPSTNWKTFFRQKDAFDFSRSKAQDLHVFAFESDTYDNNTGQRMYLVASYPVFWHYYSQLDDDRKHHYEVIPEGAVCKLYFDLEYSKTLNPGADGNRMVDLLIQYVCLSLELEFNIKCSRADVLDLDASTSEKFSRHLIFQLKNAVFKDNIHAGNFVCYIISQLITYRRECQPNKTEDNKNDPQTDNTQLNNSTIDTDYSKISTAVSSTGQSTTKVQNCELSQENSISAKNIDVESQVTIPIHQENGLISQNNKRTSREELQSPQEISVSTVCQSNLTTQCETEPVPSRSDFPVGHDTNSDPDTMKDNVKDAENSLTDVDERYLSILLNFTRDDLDSFMVKNKNGDDVLFCDLGVYTKNRNFRLYLSSKLKKKNPLVLAKENTHRLSDKQDETFLLSLVSNIRYTKATKILSFDKESDSLISYTRKRSERVDEKESIEGYSKSPYQEVDEYITSLITQDGNRGSIRHWTYFHQGELLVYEISRYRFCHNIGRQHKSNNIMFIADLQRGVFYQKCHDPDCHALNYKSQEWTLPKEVLPESYFTDIEDNFDLEMDDQELLDSTLELEQSIHDKSKDLRELEDGDDADLILAAEVMETG